jgi:hypothetical protein
MQEQFANNASTTLSGSILSGDSTLTVLSAAGFPSLAAPNVGGVFRLLIDSEIVLVTAVSGTTFTVTRAQEGTSAAAHSSGALATHILTAGAVNNAFVPPSTRVNHAASPYTVTFQDARIVVDASGGNVTVILPAVALDHGVTVKHDEQTGGLGVSNAITIQADATQVLAQPPPNQVSAAVASITVNAAAQSGFAFTFVHRGSALQGGKQPLLLE